MAQFARPDADTLIGNYVNEADGVTNIFQSIDEASANDADYIKSVASPSAEVYVCGLSNVTDPVSSTGHIMRMRYSADLEAQETIEFTQQLRQDYVNEGTPGTLISTNDDPSVPQSSTATWATQAKTLSGAQADAITDYTALFYRFSLTVV